MPAHVGGGVLLSKGGDAIRHEAEGMPYADTFTGAEAILGNVLGPMNQDVEGFSVKPDEILDAGDKVLSLGRYGGQGLTAPST